MTPLADDRVRRFLEVAGSLTSEPNPDLQLARLLEGVLQVTGAQRGFIASGDAMYSAPDESARPSQTLLNRTWNASRPLLVADALEDRLFCSAASIRGQHVRSLFAMPLRTGTETVGILCLDHTEQANLFVDNDLEFLSGIASLAAVALKAARMAAELSRRTEVEANKRRRIVSRDVGILGRSWPLKQALRRLRRLADLPYPIHLHGESGTGKELFARAIHTGVGPFIAVNCGAIPSTLAESTCFGHVRGSFSGAERDQAGMFELANGGTLFLDEVEAMSASLQEKLLRVLQDGVVRRIGDRETRAVSVRVVSASNEDLHSLASLGNFRVDLLHRLDVLRIDVPTLRERADDIPLLADHFLDEFAEETGRPRPRLSEHAIHFLCGYEWPGNVRQLQNAIRQAAALAESDLLEPKDFEFLHPAAPTLEGPLLSVDEYVRRTVLANEATMPIAEIAERLGISRKNLWLRRKSWNPS